MCRKQAAHFPAENDDEFFVSALFEQWAHIVADEADV